MPAHAIGADQHHRADAVLRGAADGVGIAGGLCGLFGHRGLDLLDAGLRRVQAEVQIVEFGDRPIRPRPARALFPFLETNEVVHAETSNSLSVLPSSDGLGDTVIPAASIAAILLSASPLPPETMAPAWPMRRPGGAVRPAMKPTTGLRRPRFASSARNCAASSSALPPISPIMMIDRVSSSARNISRMSMNSVPLTGSPPIPTAVDWPRSSLLVWNTAS